MRFCAKRHSLAFCAFSAICVLRDLCVGVLRHREPHDSVTIGRNVRLQLDSCLLHASKS